MKKQMLIFATVIVMSGIQCTEPGQKTKIQTANSETTHFESFEEAKVIFEQNATDGDVEVVFEAKAGDNGLTKLKVVAPNDRIVADFTAPDASTLGIRSFRMESPEPADFQVIKQAYPEGIYTFTGITTDGTHYKAESSLSHFLPDTISFLNPTTEAKDVPIQNLQITWTSVEGISHYLLELEDEETGANITAILPNTTTSFYAPSNFLQVDSEYKISIATVTEEGNLSFLENTFTTSKIEKEN